MFSSTRCCIPSVAPDILLCAFADQEKKEINFQYFMDHDECDNNAPGLLLKGVRIKPSVSLEECLSHTKCLEFVSSFLRKGFTIPSDSANEKN